MRENENEFPSFGGIASVSLCFSLEFVLTLCNYELYLKNSMIGNRLLF